MPDTQQLGTISLLKSALTEKHLEPIEGFEIGKATDVAIKHDISNLIYSGAVLCGLSNGNPVLHNLFVVSCTRVIFNEKQMCALDGLYRAFEKNNIDYLPLKGSVIKALYPKSEMRSMGDADILIKVEQYDKIKEVMLELGYSEGNESDHELKWKSDFLSLELHKHLISPNHKDYFEYWHSPWEKAVRNSKTEHRFNFSDEDTLIYLITHLAIHYRAGGVGIKHVIDIWVYLSKKNQLDMRYIEKELSKLQLTKFYRHIIDMIDAWFGNGNYDEITEFMTSYIFSSGAFGTYERNALARAVKTSKRVGSTKKARMKEIWNIIFLPYKNMCKKYPILKKYKLLLPVMWIVRGADVIFINRKSISKLNVGVETVTAENIEAYQEALNLVGLDFNYKE